MKNTNAEAKLTSNFSIDMTQREHGHGPIIVTMKSGEAFTVYRQRDMITLCAMLNEDRLEEAETFCASAEVISAKNKHSIDGAKMPMSARAEAMRKEVSALEAKIEHMKKSMAEAEAKRAEVKNALVEAERAEAEERARAEEEAKKREEEARAKEEARKAKEEARKAREEAKRDKEARKEAMDKLAGMSAEEIMKLLAGIAK